MSRARLIMLWVAMMTMAVPAKVSAQSELQGKLVCSGYDKAVLVTWSADGSHLMAFESQTSVYDPEPPETAVTINNCSTGKVEWTFQFSGVQWALSPDHSLLAAYSVDASTHFDNRPILGEIAIKSLVTKRSTSLSLPKDAEWDSRPKGIWLQWSVDSTRVLLLRETHTRKTLYIWDVATSALISTFDVHGRRAELSPDNRYLALCGDDDRVKIIDAASGSVVRTLASDSEIWHLMWSKNSAQIAARSDSPPQASLLIWDVATGNRLAKIPGVDWEMGSDGEHLAVITMPGRSLTIYDFTTGSLVGQMPEAPNDGLFATFSPDGKKLAAGYASGKIILWEVATRRQLAVYTGHVGKVWSVIWRLDSTLFLSVGEDKTRRVWAVAETQ